MSLCLLLLNVVIVIPLFVNGQSEEQFYYFKFEPISDWIEHNGTIHKTDTPPYDPIQWVFNNPHCPRSNAQGGYGTVSEKSCLYIKPDAFISRVISSVGYHTLRLQIDVNPWSVEANEWCYIGYRTESTEWQKTNIATGTDNHELDVEVNIPDTDTYNDELSFEVNVGIDGNAGGDNCLFDNLRVFGIRYTQNPTTDPTEAPSKYPTNHPTIYPTDASKYPTKNPTNDPTKHPTIDPTIDPTDAPSKAPNEATTDPTRYPTFNPSKEATIYYLLKSTTQMYAPNDNKKNNGALAIVLFVLGTGCSVLIVVIICSLVLLFIRKRKKEKEKQVQNDDLFVVSATKEESNEPGNVSMHHGSEPERRDPGENQLNCRSEGIPNVIAIGSMSDEGRNVNIDDEPNEIQTKGNYQREDATSGGNIEEEMNNPNIGVDEFIVR